MKENQTSYPYFEWIPVAMNDMNEEASAFKEKRTKNTQNKRMVLLCWFARLKAVYIKSTTQGILLKKTFLLTITNWK